MIGGPPQHLGYKGEPTKVIIGHDNVLREYVTINHRFGNEGGMTGPDLTLAGGRYNARDLIDNILNPSKEINEQFVPTVLTKQDGTQIIGSIVNLNNANVTVNTDPSDPWQRIDVNRATVKSIEPSKVSLMPPGLLNLLTKDEVLDLVAYVLSHHQTTIRLICFCKLSK